MTFRVIDERRPYAVTREPAVVLSPLRAAHQAVLAALSELDAIEKATSAHVVWPCRQQLSLVRASLALMEDK